jgi:hypothetical protein
MPKGKHKRKPAAKRKPMPKPSRPFQDKRRKWSAISDRLYLMLKKHGIDLD